MVGNQLFLKNIFKTTQFEIKVVLIKHDIQIITKP
jgi:hypothetical protein